MCCGLFQVDVAGLLPLTEYTITVMACTTPPDQSFSSKNSTKRPLEVTIQFTMPSAEDLADVSTGHLEPAFLQVSFFSFVQLPASICFFFRFYQFFANALLYTNSFFLAENGYFSTT